MTQNIHIKIKRSIQLVIDVHSLQNRLMYFKAQYSCEPFKEIVTHQTQ